MQRKRSSNSGRGGADKKKEKKKNTEQGRLQPVFWLDLAYPQSAGCFAPSISQQNFCLYPLGTAEEDGKLTLRGKQWGI